MWGVVVEIEALPLNVIGRIDIHQQPTVAEPIKTVLDEVRRINVVKWHLVASFRDGENALDQLHLVEARINEKIP